MNFCPVVDKAEANEATEQFGADAAKFPTVP